LSQVSEGKAMTMWEHVTELANRVKVMIMALLVTCSIGFLPTDPRGFFDPINHYQPIVSLMMLKIRHDFLPSGATLIASGLVDTIFVYMYLTLLIGVVLASPIIAYELYAYVSPALYAHERKYLLTFTGSFVGLFVVGVLMAYFLIIPITFKILMWFITSGGAAPFIGIRDFYYWVLTLMLASGIFYTVPVFILLLVQFGFIPAECLSGKRKMMVYVALLIILIIITPDPTPITAIIIMIPFIGIFEGAALAARRIEKGRREMMRETYGPTKTQLGGVACKFCEGNVSSSFCEVCGKSQV
jgi:sec-independent protein translocase protein TatC